jgi:hypothetical protein
MKKIITILIIIVLLFFLSYIDIWPKAVKSGTIKVNTYEKIELMLGLLYID